jgi:hypothetical protein
MTKNVEINGSNQNTGIKKRGRKSKKEIEEAEKISNLEKNINHSEISQNNNDNIIVNIEEDSIFSSKTNDTNLIDEIIQSDNDNDNDNDDNKLSSQSLNEKPLAKKRGRKPKGGKIIQQIVSLNNNKETKPNIILHLKCSLKDLNSTNLFGSSLEGFSFSSNQTTLPFDIISNENVKFNEIICQPAKLIECEAENDTDYDLDTCKKDNDIRDIWKKLKVLEHYMHINNINNKKSACFWDTCEFDNPPIYIPKHFMNNSYHVYGCFCSPECAVAHLMNEPIDTSTKFERYYLLNSIYGKIYDFKKNIKPAPNPYYMLEKFYGNLSIQEFRALLRNERLFLVVDKPLTRIMPELHEDNDDFIINNKIIPSNTYQIKKRLQKKQTKTNILSERFGLTH